VFSVFIYPGACPASVKSAKNYLLKQDAKKITGAVSVGYGLILQAAYSASSWGKNTSHRGTGCKKK